MVPNKKLFGYRIANYLNFKLLWKTFKHLSIGFSDVQAVSYRNHSIDVV